MDSFECIICLIENRAREVGIAAINAKSFEIYISQIADISTYDLTLNMLHLFVPLSIVLPQTLFNSAIHQRLKEASQESTLVPIEFISRKYFNSDRGFEIYQQSHHNLSDILDSKTNYVSMAALAGCVAFLESTTGQIDLSCLQIKLFNDKH